MRETREGLRLLLHHYVEEFLDHLEQDLGEDDSLGHVLIAAAVTSAEHEVETPTYYCSSDSPIWRRGFLGLLTDYHTLARALIDPDDDED